MKLSFIYLFIGVALFSSWGISQSNRANSAAEDPAATFTLLCRGTDAESILSCGRKLNFVTVDLYELELVPKVSGKLATELLAQREIILADYGKRKLPDLAESLQLASGVGKVKGRQLAEYLEVQPSTTRE